MMANVKRPSVMGTYGYTQSLIWAIDAAKAELRSKVPELAVHYKKPESPLTVLTPQDKERLWREFAEELRKLGVKPEEYRERFEAFIEPSLPYAENKRELWSGLLRDIELEVKYPKYARPPPSGAPLPQLLERIKRAEKFNLRDIESCVRRLAYDVEIMLQALNQKDPFATYYVLEDMKHTAEAIETHLRTVSPAVKDWWAWLQEKLEKGK